MDDADFIAARSLLFTRFRLGAQVSWHIGFVFQQCTDYTCHRMQLEQPACATMLLPLLRYHNWNLGSSMSSGRVEAIRCGRKEWKYWTQACAPNSYLLRSWLILAWRSENKKTCLLAQWHAEIIWKRRSSQLYCDSVRDTSLSQIVSMYFMLPTAYWFEMHAYVHISYRNHF